MKWYFSSPTVIRKCYHDLVDVITLTGAPLRVQKASVIWVKKPHKNTVPRERTLQLKARLDFDWGARDSLNADNMDVGFRDKHGVVVHVE
jgi:hypothetical protein